VIEFDEIATRFPGAGTLVKGIQLLEIMATSKEPCTSAHLLRETGLPKATLYRLLGALVEFGYVRHDTRLKTYRLGQRFIELGRSALESFDMRSAAVSELTRLSGELNETVSLAMLEQERIIHVDVRRPANPIAVGIEIGRTQPAIFTASGRAILASMPPQKLNTLVQELPPEERASVLAETAISRARGYTIADSRTLKGVVIVAAPVQGPPSAGYGALVVTAMAASLPTERRHIVGRDLMEAARRVMGNMGSAPMSITANPRRTRHVERGLECVIPAAAVVGEGPVWDGRTGVLRWVDTLAPAAHAFDPRSGQNTSIRAPNIIGAILPSDDGGCLATTKQGLEKVNLETGAFTLIYNPEAHLPGNRFNDAKTDRKGRVWSGSMTLDASLPSGSLYCFDTPTSARAVDGGFQVSNGIGWSPDDKTMYFVDTGIGTVFSYAFDLAAGTIGERRTFLQFDPKDGKPDGLSVDSQGNVWIAMWDGWRVACYAPSGKLVREIDLPVPRPSSCCFGGKDLTTLYITTASVRLPAAVLEEAPLSGGLFRIDVGVAGQATVLANA
jgi:sugar lactone lactonase YvrE/DNA-binding IclR family transcriptional regulator